MQDEVNEKTVVLVINTGKKGLHLTASMLRAAIRKYLQHLEKQKQIAEKKAEKEAEILPEGQQTMKDLMKHNTKLTNIEVTDRNIKDFEKIARKYNIDFALKKDTVSKKPKYLVFFKAQGCGCYDCRFQGVLRKDCSQAEEAVGDEEAVYVSSEGQSEAEGKDQRKRSGAGTMREDVKKNLIISLPYVFVWYLADKIGWLYRIAEGNAAGEKMVYAFMHFGEAFAGKLPSFHSLDVLAGAAGALIVRGIVYYRSKNAKKYRQGMEYGSARCCA